MGCFALFINCVSIKERPNVSNMRNRFNNIPFNLMALNAFGLSIFLFSLQLCLTFRKGDHLRRITIIAIIAKGVGFGLTIGGGFCNLCSLLCLCRCISNLAYILFRVIFALCSFLFFFFLFFFFNYLFLFFYFVFFLLLFF
jgi:hypothetical protein